MDNAKNKRIKKYISRTVLAAVVIYLAIMPMVARSHTGSDGPVASILSGTVETGSIDTVLHGGGTLSQESSVEITIPSGVKLTKFLVENGEAVAQGQPVAEVDRVSVMTAITDVQETLDHLLEEMNAADSGTGDELVAAAGGRVKLIYAREGDNVADVILEHGALAVLSLDGMMAVKLECATAHATGDSVSVTLSDGAVVTGYVESNLDSTLVVTLEDEGYAVGDKVTVASAEGAELGSGELYVHNAWNATAYSGTVKSVKIQEEDTISAGKTIFTLTDVNGNAELEQLRAQHWEYEDLMLELFRMYQSTTVTAPCDGVVSGIDRNSAHLLSGNSAGHVVSFLSNAPGLDPDAGYENYVGQITGTLGSKWTVQMDPSRQEVVDYIADIANVDVNVENMTSTGDMEMVTVYKLVDGQWEISTAAEGDILLFAWGESGCVWAVHVGHWDPAEPAVPDATDPTAPTEPSTDPTAPGDPSFTPDMPQTPSTGGSGLGGYAGGVTEEPEFQLYELQGSAIMEVTAQNTMTLTITVDEQDLHKVSVGMTAEIAVDALKGNVYTAAVTRIGSKGVNNGGSSKFDVELTLERSEDMLDGMSATATFTSDTASHILTIPVAALDQQGSKTIVYTDYDTDSGELIDPVEVTIGIADEEQAQLLSGLDAGDTYYYAYYDTPETATSASN